MVMEARRVNFTNTELEVLLSCLGERRELITKKLGGQYKSLADVRKAWAEIAKEMSACGCLRSAAEVKKKWTDLKHRTKKKASILKAQLVTGSLQTCSDLTHIEKKILLLVDDTVNGYVSDLYDSTACAIVKAEISEEQQEQVLPTSDVTSIVSTQDFVNEDSSYLGIQSSQGSTNGESYNDNILSSSLSPSLCVVETIFSQSENQSIPHSDLSQNMCVVETTLSHPDISYAQSEELGESPFNSQPEDTSKNQEEQHPKNSSSERVRKWRKLKYQKKLEQNDEDIKTLIDLKRRKLKIQEKSLESLQSIATSLQSLESTCKDVGNTLTKLAKIGCALGGLDFDKMQ